MTIDLDKTSSESEIDTTTDTSTNEDVEDEDQNEDQNEEESEESETESQIQVCNQNTSQNLETVIKTSLNNLLSKFTKNGKTSGTPKDEYDKYLNYIDSIYEGDFFESDSVNDKKKKLKDVFSEEEIKKLNVELEQIKTIYNKRVPNIDDILRMDIDISQKQKLLEKMYHFMNSDVLTTDYNSNLKFLI
jgi:hypothetical protein